MVPSPISTPLRCVAVDDETFARELLADNIRQIPFLELVAVCSNAMEVMEVLHRQPVDLLFIDIQMPGISGLQFVRNARPAPMIVFVTAYEHYAVDAFAVDAVDYLLKPVTFERFLQSANKALLHAGSRHTPKPALAPEPEYIFIHAEYNLVKVVLAQINYIEGFKDYIKIHLSQSDRPLITKSTMKAMEELLPAGRFVRVHRSYIVSLSAIHLIKKDSIRLLGGNTELPIGENYKEKITALTRV